MAYLGKEPPRSPSQSQFVETFSGDGSTVEFILTKKPVSAYSVIVFIAGVQQKYGPNYTLNGYKITFTAPPVNAIDNIVVHHVAIQEIAFVPVDGSVTADKLHPSVPFGGLTGGGTDKAFFENDQVINYNYTITENKNAFTIGPVEIAEGVEITIPETSEWKII